MKLYFSESGRLTNITDKDFLVQGNDGINIIEIYGPWAETSVVTLMFQRADGFIIGELEAKRGLDNWYFAIEDKWGVLNIPGQLQMTVSVYGGGTKQNTAMYTTNVYGSITIPNDGRSYFEWYVAEKLIEHSERINTIERSGNQIKVYDQHGNDITKEVEMMIELAGIEIIPEEPMARTLSTPTIEEPQLAFYVEQPPIEFANNLTGSSNPQYKNILKPYDENIVRFKNELKPYDEAVIRYSNKLCSYQN